MVRVVSDDGVHCLIKHGVAHMGNRVEINRAQPTGINTAVEFVRIHMLHCGAVVCSISEGVAVESSNSTTANPKPSSACQFLVVYSVMSTASANAAVGMNTTCAPIVLLPSTVGTSDVA